MILRTSILLLLVSTLTWAQKNTTKQAAPGTTIPQMSDTTFSGLKLRNIGPALTSGRIADIAIHPSDENTWYVATASGGVWKTTNAGVTLVPIFDQQGSYSIGCVTIDPSNPNTVWVGTGENVGGRHVGYGDGVYRSDDGGRTWKNAGLKNSEHISKIVVHPSNSNIVWVAAQGPLWAKGGERGIFKTTDGGKTWKRTLGDTEWVGATDVVIDSRNPDWLYAATWQRHRTIANYIGGGPGSGVHRSTDGGETWTKLSNGLPGGDMGKIGLAISLQQPDVVYAAIELDRKSGGVFKSTNRGMSWEKQSNTVSIATGPHYYQELYASPHHFDRIYLMSFNILVSDDGGKTFRDMETEHRHVDNHTIAFKKSDPNYLIVGNDGGVYESFDNAKSWRFMEHLPVTQFYKVAVDDATPFYNIYGGTQDNGTQGGPSRTDNVHGIQNSDWRLVLDWDGYQPATEPGNPNIVYAHRQEGTMSRIDMTTGEVVDIQPQSEPNEPYERFNWDAPILVSPHNPARIYHASQRVWRSDNRGDKWTAISPDLTRNQDRMTMPIMGKNQSWDEAWDVGAMSNFNTITSLSESPKQEGLIYAGTDDGIIQVTENGGANWRKTELGSIPGIPAASFVNDVRADLFDANIVYAALDNHKAGDFSPYPIKSTDRGKTWQSIRGNLPDRTLVWRVVQDHVKKDLIFAATEFGIYFTLNGGARWMKLTGDMPTISFRDVTIQRRENDLVGASFGRGFFVFDDYSVLREVSDQQLQQEATLFPARKAWWYIQRSHLSFDEEKGGLGADHYVAPNPKFGATFTYYLKTSLKTKEAARKDAEQPLRTKNQNIPWPGWDALKAEAQQDAPRIWLTVKDASGAVVRRIEGPMDKGFHRVTWDLRYPAPESIGLSNSGYGFGQLRGGMLAAPGTYTVTLSKQVDGVITELSKSVSFVVEPLRKGSLPGSTPQEAAAFWRTYEHSVRNASALQMEMDNTVKRIAAMQKAAAQAKVNPGDLDAQIYKVRMELMELNARLNGDPAKSQIGERSRTVMGTRLFGVSRGIYHSTYGPTETNKRALAIVDGEVKDIQTQLNAIKDKMTGLAKALIEAGAPWVEGDPLPDK
ncbi:MAG: glycosyl hydrolase [Bacteroidetes bacterium]|nr:glycosyl hydrolase [Bacteroidota bacterium]